MATYSFTCDTGEAVLLALDAPKDRLGRTTRYGSVVWAKAEGDAGTGTVVASKDGMKAYLVSGEAPEVTAFTVTATDVDGSAHEPVTIDFTATEPDAVGAPGISAGPPVDKATVPAPGF